MKTQKKNIFVHFVLCTLFSISSLYIFAQTPLINDCPSDHLHQKLLQENTEYAKKYARFEKLYHQRVTQQKQSDKQRQQTVYTMPVVVHIIHSGEAIGTVENPSDATIINSINVTSQRFRHTQSGANTYAPPLDAYYGADTELEICLANEDPDGNYTNGIIRYHDPINTLNPSASFLNSIKWDTDLYINMFIATDIGGPCGYYTGGSNDYTVYLASCYNTGLVAHELGHYFSLAHTFLSNGDCTNNDCLTDGDGVCDTPPKLNSGFTGTPCASPGNECTTDEDDTSTNNPFRPVSMGGIGDQNDMLENYMDYTGSCWDCFSQGQKTRMRAYIDANRVNLRNNTSVCSNTPTTTNDAGIPFFYNGQMDVCDSEITPVVTIQNYGSNVLNSMNIEVWLNSSLLSTESWSGTLESGASTTFALSAPINLPPGSSTLSINTSSPNGVTDSNTANDATNISLDFFGGSPCSLYAACSDMNPNTSSGPGNTTIVNLVESFPTSVSNVQICVTVEGDNSFSGETFTILDESGNNRGITNFGGDCTGPSAEACFTPTIANYTSWISDGTITITLDPTSTAINPILCSTNEVCANLYIAESSCPPDIELTGIIPSGTYQSMNYIICSGTVSSSETVTLRTDNTIDLEVGFEVVQGAVFDANTQGSGCN